MNILIKIIKEEVYKEILKEINFKPKKPLQFKYFKISDSQHQYKFQTKNDNYYGLSIIKTNINIDDENVLKFIDYSDNKNIPFNAINFFDASDNPNIQQSYEKITNNAEIIILIRNIKWLLRDFIKKNPHEKNFIFSAEEKRMGLYKYICDKISGQFNTFEPKKYDKSYKHKQMILIKK